MVNKGLYTNLKVITHVHFFKFNTAPSFQCLNNRLCCALRTLNWERQRYCALWRLRERVTVLESSVVRAGGRNSVCLNRKLFVDKWLAERKCALEEGSTCINQSRRKTEREHTCSSAFSPQEGEKNISRLDASRLCMCRECVCASRCAQVFSKYCAIWMFLSFCTGECVSYLTALERLHILCVSVVCVSVSGRAVSVLVQS